MNSVDGALVIQKQDVNLTMTSDFIFIVTGYDRLKYKQS